MIKIVYYVPAAKETEEDKWLSELKVYPAKWNFRDLRTDENMIGFGVIVGPDSALMIKLRHTLQLQTDYRQR